MSDSSRNGFFSRPNTTKDIQKGTIGLFHTLPEKLQISAVMVAMEDAPATRDSNNTAWSIQRQHRREREELLNQKRMKDASN